MVHQINPATKETTEMFSSKIRISIVTAAAALSILADGPITPVASARKPRKEVKIGNIEVDCPVEHGDGTVDWYPEGTREVFETQSRGPNGEIRLIEAECKGGHWVSVLTAPTPPKTTQTGPSTPPLTNG